MGNVAKRRILRTTDLREIVAAVSELYCPHEVHLHRGKRVGHTEVELAHAGVQPVIQLSYAAPVIVDAGAFPALMLIQTCLSGSGNVRQGAMAAPLRSGQTIPLSPGLNTLIEFDQRFVQRSVRLNIDRAEALCARWLNTSLDRPLRLSLEPFSAELETTWSQAVSLILGYESNNLVLPPAAASSFDEFLLSLVLSRHPHNYTESLRSPAKALAPRLVREAEHLMRIGGPDTSVSDIALELRVSLRSLEKGFRDTYGCTPTDRLRRIRLTAARAELLSPSPSTTVTAVALANGFFHLARFSAHYRGAFGEMPIQTLRRNRPAQAQGI